MGTKPLKSLKKGYILLISVKLSFSAGDLTSILHADFKKAS